MKVVYLWLDRSIYAICRILKQLLRTAFYLNYPPDEMGVGIKRHPRLPRGTGTTEARAEVEGSNFSLIP